MALKYLERGFGLGWFRVKFSGLGSWGFRIVGLKELALLSCLFRRSLHALHAHRFSTAKRCLGGSLVSGVKMHFHGPLAWSRTSFKGF